MDFADGGGDYGRVGGMDVGGVDHFDELVWIDMNREGDTACVVVTRDGRYGKN